MTLDPRPSEPMREDAGGGNGMAWVPTLRVEQERKLVLSGSYGSPLTWGGSYELEARGDGARLRFTERMFGCVTAADLAGKDHVWRYLNDGCSGPT